METNTFKTTNSPEELLLVAEYFPNVLKDFEFVKKLFNSVDYEPDDKKILGFIEGRRLNEGPRSINSEKK